jgi:hypothetical protein
MAKTPSPNQRSTRRASPLNHAVSDAATGSAAGAGQSNANGNTSTSDWLDERLVEPEEASAPGVAIDTRTDDPRSLPGRAIESKRGQQ